MPWSVVAVNRPMGMLTKPKLRNPVQVARATVVSQYVRLAKANYPRSRARNQGQFARRLLSNERALSRVLESPVQDVFQRAKQRTK